MLDSLNLHEISSLDLPARYAVDGMVPGSATRNPERHVRPREQVFNMNYQPPADQLALGRKLVAEYEIKDPKQITSCSICHR